jgi:hypothetical protein
MAKDSLRRERTDVERGVGGCVLVLEEKNRYFGLDQRYGGWMNECRYVRSCFRLHGLSLFVYVCCNIVNPSFQMMGQGSNSGH